MKFTQNVDTVPLKLSNGIDMIKSYRQRKVELKTKQRGTESANVIIDNASEFHVKVINVNCTFIVEQKPKAY